MSMATASRPRRVTAPLPHTFPTTALPSQPVVVYVRKSSEAADAQALSHEQQLERIYAAVPPDVVQCIFRDSKSGTTFDRPGLVDMLAWCRARPQPRTAPGRIVCYAKDRFGRALIPGTEETDWDAWDEARLGFSRCGWRLEFVSSRRTGNAIGDRILDTIEEEGASEYLRALRRNTMRGRENAARAGYWSSGVAPFPTTRALATTGVALGPKERAPAGARVVLRGDPDGVRHWEHGARMLVDHMPWRRVVDYFRAHVPPLRVAWSRQAVRLLYTNEALVGTLSRKIGGLTLRVPAKWGPLVDPALFAAVQAELTRRERRLASGLRAGPAGRQEYLIRGLCCVECGARYRGGVRAAGASGPEKRYYVHPTPGLGTMPNDVERRALERGCRGWYVPADQTEAALRDLILRERGSRDWSATVRRLYAESGAGKSAAEAHAADCRAAVAAVQSALDANLLALDKATPGTVEIILARVETKNRELADARRALAAAEAQVSVANSAGDEAARVVEETVRIAETWDDPDARQRVLDWWVEHAEISVHPTPGESPGATLYHKQLHVTLHTSPDDPRVVRLPSHVVNRPRNERSSCDTSLPPSIFSIHLPSHQRGKG